MACMGIATADFDEDGMLDIFVTNFEDQWANMYMQRTAGIFQDEVVRYGLSGDTFRLLGFGTEAIDHNNDGSLDLIIGNGNVEDFTHHGREFAMPTQFFISSGQGFVQTVVKGDDAYWGTNHLSRGLATLDWNRDGKMDVVITDLQEDAVLLENQGDVANRWLRLELVGTSSERDAIGARVIVEVADKKYTQSVQTGGYLSSNERILHFGLGQNQAVDQVTITWPSGKQQRFADVQSNTSLLIVRKNQTNTSTWVLGHKP